MTAVLSGEKVRQVAGTYEMAPATLSRLVQRVNTFGQIACVPHRVYHREPELRPEFQALIRKLYTRRLRPSIMAVYEDARLKRLAEELSAREGKLVQGPTRQSKALRMKQRSLRLVLDSSIPHLREHRRSPTSSPFLRQLSFARSMSIPSICWS